MIIMVRRDLGFPVGSNVIFKSVCARVFILISTKGMYCGVRILVAQG